MNRRKVAALWNASSFGSWAPWKSTVQLTAAIVSCSQTCLQQILLPSQSGAVSQIHCFPDSWLELPGKPRSPENCFRVGQMHSFSCQHLHLFPHRNSTAPEESIQGIPINFFPQMMHPTYTAAKSKSAGILSWKTNKQNSWKHTLLDSWAFWLSFPKCSYQLDSLLQWHTKVSQGPTTWMASACSSTSCILWGLLTSFPCTSTALPKVRSLWKQKQQQFTSC